ncbi:glycosyltransferase [Acuticoccus yangtzensis]|uniref:glycosyltransferase n=1 Tax=Acuticoccus yangtzensis TaxID=1443441 RepID=UPI000B05C34B|nr:glycosyltransferase [Acuticoccus yangtzensis]
MPAGQLSIAQRPEAAARRSRAPRTPQKASPPVVALKPLSAEGNAFSGAFSGHMDAAFKTVGFAWDRLGTRAYDVVVFHWPTEFFRPTRRKDTLALLARMAADKARGTRFLWVAHNLAPHDGGSMASPATTAMFLRLLDGVIYLSHHSRREAETRYPVLTSKPALVTVHGRYDECAVPPRPHTAGAGRLLTFGLIRAYKNVTGLVKAAHKVTAEPFSLTVAGTPSEDGLAAEIAAAAQGEARVTLDIRDHLMPADELERMIDAHDAVVLPYKAILNSGVALHALARNRPILAPRLGSLAELQDTVGPDFVHLFDGPIAAPVLDTFLGRIAGRSLGTADLSKFGWDRVGADVSGFIASLLNLPTSELIGHRP